MHLDLPSPRWSAFLVPGGLIAASMLATIVLLRYPHAPEGVDAPLAALIVAPVCVLLGLAVLWADTRPRKTGTARWSGIQAGLICGAIWVAEISFNNFVDPRWSNQASRLVLDDSAWALIALIIAAASFRESRRGSLASGLAAGLWSGTVSGLAACLMALSLIVFAMPSLLADPLNLKEYAALVPSGTPDMATYWAYETLTGAFGHLVVLGAVMGLLLGLLGGVAGMALRRRPALP